MGVKANTFYSAPVVLVIFSLLAGSSVADPVRVRHAEGLIRGFLLLRDQNNKILASGDISQLTTGTRVASNLTFHFRDGSIREETTVFSQRRDFGLLSYHLVEKGKAFRHSIDLRLNATTGNVTVRSVDERGKEESISDHVDLPDDVANGLITTLMNDLDPEAPKTTVSLLVATPKPRLIKVDIISEGEESFSVGGSPRKALRYVVKVRLGGVSGVIAPIIGKQPPDTHVWMCAGSAPAFLKSEGPLYEGGPIWRIELTSPVWPGDVPATKTVGTNRR